MRILASGRLSQARDGSTSLERQEEGCRGRAPAYGEVIAWTADDGISGAVSPFDRPALGPWLTDNPPEPWDILMAWKLDRVSRSARDALELAEWLSARGKRLVTVQDNIDTGGLGGKLLLTILAAVAELEREMIAERTAGARAALVAAGYWNGGQIPWGYTVVEDGAHKRIVIDEGTRGHVVQAFEWAAEGRNPAWIARQLQAKGLRPPRGGESWSRKTVAVLLERDLYIGLGHVPAIVDPELFLRAGERLAEAKTGRAARATSGHWSGVVFCAVCGGKMWTRNEARRGRVYYCQTKGHTIDIREDVIDEAALIEFVSAYGSEPVVNVVVHPDTTASEIALTRAKLDRVNDALRTASAADKGPLRAERTALEDTIDELEAQPPKADRIEHLPTGETWQQRAESLPPVELADEMKLRGFRFGIRLVSRKPFELQISFIGEHQGANA
jgi:DNA invertase Pin-like site-specific DNA recombinase